MVPKIMHNGCRMGVITNECKLEEKIRDIQKILIEDDRIPISSGREINKALMEIRELALKIEKEK